MVFLSFISYLTSQIKQSILKKSKILGVFVVSLVLVACQSQTGQEQKIASNSGFGGTGIIAEDPTSGFGGTGRASSGFGGTGVIGTITKFGSIWVNGIEVGYGEQTKITSDLTQNDVLKLGQQVILETLPREDKALTKAIHIYYPLAGKITEVTQNGLMIGGKYRVSITEQTKLDAAIELKVGQFIAVSGYQTDAHRWTATRLNLNTHKIEFYHPEPTREFSAAIKRVIIESSLKQLSQWKKFSKVNLEAVEKRAKNGRLIIEGILKNGRIESKKIAVYGPYIVHQATENLIDKPLQHQSMPMQNRSQEKIEVLKDQQESMKTQKDQHEMMQMQKDHQSIIQDQVSQIQQIQELQQIQDIRNLQEQIQQIQTIQDLKSEIRGVAP